MSAIMEINIPAEASEVTLKTAGKYCSKDIRVTNRCRIESGVYEVTQDQLGTSNVYKFNIPCSSGAKMFFIQADDTTYDAIINSAQNTTGPFALIGAVGSCMGKIGQKDNRGLMSYMGNTQRTDGSLLWGPIEKASTCDNTNGIAITTYGVKAGKYNWAAYYWNEQEE